MGSLPAQDPETRGIPRRYLLVSDTHYERGRDVQEDVDLLADVYDQYDCDEILVAGDVGSFDDVEALLEGDFEATAVRGNNDAWDVPGDDHPDLRYLADGGRVFYGDEAAWTVGPYTVELRHRPHAFDIRARSGMEDTPDTDADILIHGHSHMPSYRVLGGGTLALGAGSLAENYNVTPPVPERSLQIVEIGDTVTVQHIDADTRDVVETAIFAYEDGFETVRHDTAWDGSRFTR